MAFLMLFLLAAIALIITFVGYLLTPKPQPRNSRAAYPAGYYGNGSRRIAVREPLSTRRIPAVAYTEYSPQSTWLDMWPSLIVSRLSRWRAGEPTPWMGITLILLSVFLLGIFLMRTLMPNATLVGAISWSYTAVTSSSTNSNSASDRPYPASKALVRLNQLDPAQYNSTQEYDLWAYGACSAAALTEVINAYGHHYRITDILKVESQIGEITPQLGLVEDVGIERTATRFGFKTSWGNKLSLDDVITIANHGRPVIVDFPPYKYDGGHLLVVIGGNSDNVFLADSSSYNHKVLARAQFMQWWAGFSAILTPN